MLTNVILSFTYIKGEEDAPYLDKEILIKFKESVDANTRNTFVKDKDLILIRNLPRINIYQYQLPEKIKVSDAVENFNRDPRVEFAEPNYIRKPLFSNDPRVFEQWSLNNTGQLVNGISGPANVDINLPEALNIFTGSKEVIVAVIDSGVGGDHPELFDNIAFNFSEFNFTNSVENPIGVDGKDNDENGFPDDFAGWDFFDDDNVPFDENGHGTLVASIIAAESNNNIGIAGISPTAHILPIRVLDDFGRGEIPNLGVSDLVLAIDYALRRNAKIINISFGGIGFSQTEELVFEFTDKAGVLMVIAAGNGQFVGDGSGDDNDISPTYPASYLSSNIISVAAVDRSGQLSFFSNYGLNSVDIAAPGTDILGSDITREVIFFEDFEIGAPDWTSGQGFLNASPFTWAIVNFSDNSFLDDGSGANAYVNNTETFAISPVIDLTGSLGPQLSFKADYAIARVFPFSFDFVALEASKNGVIWEPYNFLSGSSTGFSEQTFDISDLEGTVVQFRFRLKTDTIFVSEGIQIDDVKITQVKLFEPENPQYQILSGTSFSAPMVAGVAALIMSQRPELTHHQVRDLILQNTNLVSELQGRIVTGGHLDAHKALQAAIELNTELGVIFGGYGTQLGFDIQHPNGNIYDQVLMSGPMVKVKADANQITRVSFIDENDDIIQVEFSGSGTLTIDLDLATYEAPGLPKNYNQFISYVKGRAKILIEDADQSSFISVFSVGSITAINQSFIRTDINYNGQADIALVDISGTGFGGILCGNAVFASASGIIGIEAPNVPIEFRVIIGDIDARGAAVPVLNIGQGSSLASDAGALLVGGGDLFQTNGSRIFVSESGANPGYQSIRSISNVRSDGTALSARSIISGFQDRSGETVSIPFFVTQ